MKPKEMKRLIPRQRLIVELAAQDKTAKQIADHLDLSPATVNHHWRRILERLGVHSRTAAVALVLRPGTHRLNQR